MEIVEEKKTFKNYCTCGGYASSMNGRDPKHPHMDYCPQLKEWEEWQAKKELNDNTTN